MEKFCFMIQPFDGGKFDKRYEDVFKPAIIEAGLEPYRVDSDDLAQIPINTIEDKIKAAAVCVADITLNNPNVWYEVGYALASNVTTILICSDEREDKYPFDVSSRNILRYKTESMSDYNEFKEKLVSRINKLKNNISLESIETLSRKTDDFDGLSYQEVAFIGALMSTQDSPEEFVSAWGIKEQMKKSGLNELAFNLCARKLVASGFVHMSTLTDYNGNEYIEYNLTDKGNDWVIKNTDKFSLKIQIEENDKEFC